MSDTRRYFQSPFRTIGWILLLCLAFLWLVPIFSALVTSLRTFDDLMLNGPFTIPRELVFSNFRTAWERARVDRYLLNSFLITIPVLILCLFLSSLSAFALARFKFPGSKALYFMYVGGTLLPFQVLLLPVFKLADALGLYDTHLALILFHTAFQLGFCTFLLRNYMRTIPGEIIEAARIDGCSDFRIYAQIILPLVLPAMAALATLEFTWIFNDYLWALILLRSDSLKPITTGLAALRGQYISDWGVITAGALIATLPTLSVFVFLQRYFIEGLTLGANK